MVNEVLTASGIPYRKTRFLKPPASVYAVYLDDVETDGPDGKNRIYNHSISVEVYAGTPAEADQAESKLEQALDEAGLQYTKQAQYWLADTQRYQTIYEFDYIVKN